MERSQITKTKINLLNQGVCFGPPNLFTDFPNINRYKTKHLYTRPTIIDGRVFDLSKEENLIPSELLLHDDSRVSLTKLRFNPDSELILEADGAETQLSIGGRALDLVSNLVPKEEILERNTPLEVGGYHTKVGDYIDIVGLDRVSILFFDGCSNWNYGKQCQFCDLHPRRVTDQVIRPTTNRLRDFQDDTTEWWDENREDYFAGLRYAMQQIDQDLRFNHGNLYFMAGNLPESEDTWRIARDLIGDLAREIDLSKYQTILNIAPHDSLESLCEIKRLGIKQVQYNLEVISRDLFEQICPGKLNYDAFIAKLIEAVGVFGFGSVRSNFVFGLQSKEELLKGIDELAQNGIVADYSAFQPKKNTPLCNLKSPSQDDVLDFTDRLVEIYLQYGFKPIFSTVSSRSSVINEVYNDRLPQSI